MAVSGLPQNLPDANEPTVSDRAEPMVSRKGTWFGMGSDVLTHVVLIIGALSMIIPFYWMVTTALKDLSQAFLIPPLWIPDPIRWENFPNSLDALPFGRAYFNSAYIAVLTVLGTLLTSSMAGYAFARVQFPLKGILFTLFLATLMIPGQITIIPQYLIMRDLGWLDTHIALIVPSVMFSAFGVFLLRQFILSLPGELEESAVLDGANRFRIYWQIILPLLRAPMSALAIFVFLGSWNDVFRANIFLSSPDLYTVPLLLNQFRGLYITDWTLLMAGATIAIIPVLIVYLIGQRYIIEGVAMTGLKA